MQFRSCEILAFNVMETMSKKCQLLQTARGELMLENVADHKCEKKKTSVQKWICYSIWTPAPHTCIFTPTTHGDKAGSQKMKEDAVYCIINQQCLFSQKNLSITGYLYSCLRFTPAYYPKQLKGYLGILFNVVCESRCQFDIQNDRRQVQILLALSWI